MKKSEDFFGANLIVSCVRFIFRWCHRSIRWCGRLCIEAGWTPAETGWCWGIIPLIRIITFRIRIGCISITLCLLCALSRIRLITTALAALLLWLLLRNQADHAGIMLHMLVVKFCQNSVTFTQRITRQGDITILLRLQMTALTGMHKIGIPRIFSKLRVVTTTAITAATATAFAVTATATTAAAAEAVAFIPVPIMPIAFHAGFLPLLSFIRLFLFKNCMSAAALQYNNARMASHVIHRAAMQ
jgi:hypothetical protein